MFNKKKGKNYYLKHHYDNVFQVKFIRCTVLRYIEDLAGDNKTSICFLIFY